MKGSWWSYREMVKINEGHEIRMFELNLKFVIIILEHYILYKVNRTSGGGGIF